MRSRPRPAAPSSSLISSSASWPGFPRRGNSSWRWHAGQGCLFVGGRGAYYQLELSTFLRWWLLALRLVFVPRIETHRFATLTQINTPVHRAMVAVNTQRRLMKTPYLENTRFGWGKLVADRVVKWFVYCKVQIYLLRWHLSLPFNEDDKKGTNGQSIILIEMIITSFVDTACVSQSPGPPGRC